jgi:hypothetical protein
MKFCKYSILFLTLIFSFCTQKINLPENAADQYARWFITLNKNLFDSLVSYKNFEILFDSIAKESQKKYRGKSGTYSIALEDSLRLSYIVGWKTPKNIRNDTTYPLIIYLHGGTSTLKTDKGEKAYDMLSALSDTFDLFLASPSANMNAPWWSSIGIWRILQTIRFMSLLYPINQDKIFLAGVSDGATGCYLASNTINNVFAGFIAVSGYGGMLRSFGIELFPQNLMQRNILNINGGKDHLYPISYVKDFISWLESNGVNIEHREYLEEGHGFDYREKEMGNLAKIIRNWSKEKNNNSIFWIFSKGFPNIVNNCIYWELLPETKSSINAFWKNDTFVVKTSGVKKIYFAFENLNNPLIYISLNGIKPKIYKPLKMNTKIMLLYVANKLSPIPKNVYVYNVEVKNK